ncbi:MAG: HD-GYP domain-containing protein [Lachnospiraceae bacterium]
MPETFKLEIFVNEMLSYIQGLLMIIVMLSLQHLIFLEFNTEKQKKITKIIVFVLTAICTVISFLMGFNISSPILKYIRTICGLLLFFPSIYSSITGRKKAKWLGLFILVPMMGYFDAIYTLVELPVTVGFVLEENKKVYEIIVCSAVLAVLALLMYNKPPFLRRLERDIEKRTLNGFEEIGLWAVGIWLVIYDVFISSLFPDIPSSLNAYLDISNFIEATVIILLIVDSNYRNFYYKQNSTLQKSLITTMADLVENRDENTGGHIQRTAKYVEIIARKLKSENKFTNILTDKYIEDMVIASPLHDVGKIHIPDAVLNKPGKLDDSEFTMMKSHAAAGGKIINRVEESVGDINYLRIAKEMAEYHHERMDGKGYPHGITGEEIPLCAKILAVADVFDALISKRCYKEPMPLDKAFTIIAEESGSHFDTDVANAFLESRSEIEQFINELSIE